MKLVFACVVGAGDLLYVVYHVPTICIARAQQRGKAAERLGLPRPVYDDVRALEMELKGMPAILPAPLSSPADSLTTHTQLPARQEARVRDGGLSCAGEGAQAVTAPDVRGRPQKRPRAEDTPTVTGGAVGMAPRDVTAPHVHWMTPHDCQQGRRDDLPGISQVTSPDGAAHSAALVQQEPHAAVATAVATMPSSPFCDAPAGPLGVDFDAAWAELSALDSVDIGSVDLTLLPKCSGDQLAAVLES